MPASMSMSESPLFEQLVSWQRMHELHSEICRATQDGTASANCDFRNEIRNAASAAERHIVNGFGRYKPAVFANFLEFSRTAACETRSLLRKGLACGYFSEESFEQLDRLVVRALWALVSFQRYLRSPAAKRGAALRYPRPYSTSSTNSARAPYALDEPSDMDN
jgi:four helix bundle protein